MLNTNDYLLLAGNPGPWDDEIRQLATGAQWVGSFNLPALQELQHRRGRRSAEVVKSLYGFGVRSASGLDGFRLLAAKPRELKPVFQNSGIEPIPGTYASAVAWAMSWAAEDPTNREAFVRNGVAEPVVLVEVEMLAFGKGKIRTVVIPEAEEPGQATESPYWRDLTLPQRLDRVFYYGQNDWQPVRQRPSVSVGDVIRLDGNRYTVDPAGFTQLNSTQLERRKA
jgi:hypothetical protein